MRRVIEYESDQDGSTRKMRMLSHLSSVIATSGGRIEVTILVQSPIARVLKHIIEHLSFIKKIET